MMVFLTQGKTISILSKFNLRGRGPVSLQQSDAVAFLSANGCADFNESCAPILDKIATASYPISYYEILYFIAHIVAVYHFILRTNRTDTQIPQCTSSIFHNAQFRTEMCRFLFRMVHGVGVGVEGGTASLWDL